MGEWSLYRMEDLIDEISMGPFGSDIKVSCFVDDGIPVLNGSNLSGVRLTEESFRFITEEKADSLKKANAARGDVVVTHRGTLGQIAYIPQGSRYPRYVISQSQFRFRLNERATPEYVVNYFHTPQGRNKILAYASQVGVPAIARASSSFREIEIPLPDLQTQRKIAAVLSALDDKIENNRRICKTLEEMAQAIFKSWFVDFEPWGGVMPEGWRREPLSNVADFLNGLAMQKYRPKDGEGSLPVLKIKELRQGYCDETSEACSANIPEKFIVHDGDVIFSWSGSLLVDFWCGGTVGLNQHLFKVTSPRFPKWYVYAWTQYHLASFIKIAADKATTMGHITRDHLDDALVWVPDLLTMNQLGDLLSSVYDLLISCRLENRSLSSMRDTLLPKLMSGEIDVDKVEV